MLFAPFQLIEHLKAETKEDKRRAYEIIKENRTSKGYPLKMTWEQVLSTVENVAKADFFITKTNDLESSAAIVFHINSHTVQVIYWGANPHGEKCNVMYYMPFKVMEYYKNIGIRYIDIGPSSELGNVSLGLNDFKQVIGSTNTLKETWIYNND